MLRQSVLIVLLIMLSPVALLITAAAALGKTDDLLIVSGGENEKRLKSENLLQIEKDEYLIYGDFSIASRADWALPLELKIWSRGTGEVSFIDLTPLVGVFDGPRSPADLGNVLFKTEKGSAQFAPESTDRQRLESLVSEPPDRTNERLRWQRRVALEQMQRFNLSTSPNCLRNTKSRKPLRRVPGQLPSLGNSGNSLGLRLILAQVLMKLGLGRI